MFQKRGANAMDAIQNQNEEREKSMMVRGSISASAKMGACEEEGFMVGRLRLWC